MDSLIAIVAGSPGHPGSRTGVLLFKNQSGTGRALLSVERCQPEATSPRLRNRGIGGLERLAAFRSLYARQSGA